MHRPRPLPRWAGLVATAACVLVVGPPPASADVTGACTVTFNGIPVESIDSLSSPLELDHDAVLTFEGTDDGGTAGVTVELIAASITIDEGQSGGAAPGAPFLASLELEDVTPYGVGLYRIRGTTDNCTAEAWLRITGRSPFATLAGLTAAGLALGGLLGQGAALVARRRSTPLIAALGGLATGFGAALLGQQFGRLQLSYVSLSIVVGGAVLAGALLGVALLPRRSPKEQGRPEGRLPHPVAPSPAPHAGPAALRIVEEGEASTGREVPASEPERTRREVADEPAAAPVMAAATQSRPKESPESRLTARSTKESEAAGPRLAEPSTTEPDARQPRLAEPSTTEPDTTRPRLAEPSTSEPDPTRRDVTEPSIAERAAGPSRTTPEPYWCYVMAPVEVFDLRDHTKVVTTLTPGSWYLAKRESGGWAHVVTTTGESGWVPRRSLHRQG